MRINGLPILCLLALAIPAQAGTAILTWDPSPSTDIALYRVYRSHVSGAGYVLVGTVTTTGFTDASIPEGQEAHWVVTAVDYSGGESAHSNEACRRGYRVPAEGRARTVSDARRRKP